ncbi:hypothetical protein ACIBSV_11015 [Embleya sp. NPDC050154]|uniref:hypothetical protein n=1 Tax=unclassified Embleya TaxID=2699296 RepID=UPI0037A80765
MGTVKRRVAGAALTMAAAAGLVIATTGQAHAAYSWQHVATYYGGYSAKVKCAQVGQSYVHYGAAKVWSCLGRQDGSWRLSISKTV